jgi:hypothetical protein
LEGPADVGCSHAFISTNCSWQNDCARPFICWAGNTSCLPEGIEHTLLLSLQLGQVHWQAAFVMVGCSGREQSVRYTLEDLSEKYHDLAETCVQENCGCTNRLLFMTWMCLQPTSRSGLPAHSPQHQILCVALTM